MHSMTFLVSPHGGILGLLFAAVRLWHQTPPPPSQMTHSWCSSFHDEPLDGINGEQDIVLPISITWEIMLVVIKHSKCTSMYLMACHGSSDLKEHFKWIVRFVSLILCSFFMQDTVNTLLASYIFYPVAWSSCLDKISSMKSPLLPHAEKHQWRGGSPPICLVSDCILLYICMWQGRVCAPDGYAWKPSKEALHMLNLGFSKIQDQSCLSFLWENYHELTFEARYVTTVLVEVEQSGDHRCHTSTALLRTWIFEFWTLVTCCVDLADLGFKFWGIFMFTDSYKTAPCRSVCINYSVKHYFPHQLLCFVDAGCSFLISESFRAGQTPLHILEERSTGTAIMWVWEATGSVCVCVCVRWFS